MMNPLAVRSRAIAWLIFLPAVSVCIDARGCEPIVPLYTLLAGSTAAGPALLMHSLPWLLAAVILKCAAFAVFEHRLPWRCAVVYMLAANLVSTIPGVLVAGFTSSIGGIILAIPLVVVMGLLVRRRVLLLPQPGPIHWISGGAVALAFTVFFIVSVVMFGLAGEALASGGLATYWLLKFLFVALAAGTGMFISAVLEEGVIAHMARKGQGNVSFYTPVFRANYVTLGIVLLVAAVEILPKRLNAPHFIVTWFHAFFGSASV